MCDWQICVAFYLIDMIDSLLVWHVVSLLMCVGYMSYRTQIVVFPMECDLKILFCYIDFLNHA